MPKRKSTYLAKPPSARARQRAANGRLSRLRRLSLWMPRPGRELVILGTIGLATLVAVGALAGAMLLAKIDRDWASVANVNGHDISRETVRSRVKVTSLLAEQRDALVTRFGGGTLTGEEVNALRLRALAPLQDPAAASLDGLIEDELIRQLAAREGVPMPSGVDPWAEAATFISQDVCHKVRYVRFGLPAEGPPAEPAAGGTTKPWPSASQSTTTAATERLRAELAADTPVEAIVAGLHDAGWKVLGVDTVVSAEGIPGDPTLELDSSIAAAAVRGRIDDIAGPTTDLYSRVSMGRLLLPPSQTYNFAGDLQVKAKEAEVDEGALRSWAEGRALRRALAASVAARWAGEVQQAHLREIVIGDAPTSTSGPWVELNGLALDSLSGVAPTSIPGAPGNLDLQPEALARTLRDLPMAERIALFRALVKAANDEAGASGHPSGELEFARKGDLIPDVGDLAFDSKARSGDILGPVSTSAGPKLFLLEARFPGALDARATAALSVVRGDPTPDPLAYTTRFSPADAVRARDGDWRAADEFSTAEAVRSSLFDTPIGLLSDPFVLDGKLALAIVDERRSAAPDSRMADRLYLDGFDAWYDSERSKASISRSKDPLPELHSPTPPPAWTPPAMPSLPTAALPTIPGLPGATPVKTNELGLPELP